MAVLYGNEMTKLRVSPETTPDPGGVDGTVRVFHETFTMAAQGTSDTIEVGRMPKGARFLYGVLTPSATMGAAATVAIGITGATGKYRAAAVATAITPQIFGIQAGQGTALADEEIVFITIAVAALAAAGDVSVDLYYAWD